MENPLTWARRVPALLGERVAAWGARLRTGPPDGPTGAAGTALRRRPGVSAADSPAEPPRDPPLSGTRILLVDDHPVARELAGAVLRRAGAEVLTAADGESALQCLACEAVDAVLMDVEMPGLDGCETTRRLRAVPGLAGLPVIAMTGYTSPQDRHRVIAAGMNDQVDKPIRAARLVDVLQQWATGVRLDPPGPRGHPAAGEGAPT